MGSNTRTLAVVFAAVIAVSMVAMGATLAGAYPSQDDRTANDDRTIDHRAAIVASTPSPELVGRNRADAAFSSGGMFWQGQRLGLEIPADVADADRYVLREYETGADRTGSFVREFSLDENDQHFLRTGTLDGTYAITPTGERGTVVQFDRSGVATGTLDAADARPVEINVQQFSAEWTQDRITTGDSEVEIDVLSNRARYNLKVSAEGLDFEDLENMFRSTQSHRNANDPFDDRNPFAEGHDTYDAYADEDAIVLRGYGDGSLLADFREIDPGTYTVEFEVTDTGVRTATVPGEDEAVEDDPDPAFFEVENLDPITTTVEPGTELTVSATVTNTGEQAGDQTVEFRIDGDRLASQQLTLDPNDSQNVSLVATAPEAEGTYTYGVYTDDAFAEGTVTVEAPEAPIEDDGPEADDDPEAPVEDDDPEIDDDEADDDPEAPIEDDDPGVDDDTDDGVAGFGIAAAVLGVLTVLVILIRRQQ